MDLSWYLPLGVPWEHLEACARGLILRVEEGATEELGEGATVKRENVDPPTGYDLIVTEAGQSNAKTQQRSRAREGWPASEMCR